MISLEQVKLLEAKVAKAIEYVEQVNAENAALASEKAGLQAKLEANKKRIDELEVVVMRFKDDQGRIEDGILSALNRLSQFEEAVEMSLKEKQGGKKAPAVKSPVKPKESGQPNSAEVFFEIPEKDTEENGDSSAEAELDIF